MSAVYSPESEQPGNLENKPGSHDDVDLSDDELEAVKNLEGRLAEPSYEGETVSDRVNKAKKDKTASASDLESAEKGTPSDQVGKGFNNQAKSRMASVRNIVIGTKKRRGLLVGGGIGAAIVAMIVSAFLALLPLKVLHIVENVQNRFYATSENAMSNESDKLLNGYIKKYVAPALTHCPGSTIDKSCNTIVGNGGNPVTNLYRAWSHARLENTLAEKYGIIFEYHSNSRKYFLKAPGLDKEGEYLASLSSVGGAGIGQDDLLTDIKDPKTRSEIRQEVRDALGKETKWKQVMYRFKVGRLLEEKYNLKRCVFYCKWSDAFNDWKDHKVLAAKYKIIQTVIEPNSEGLGLALQCVIRDGGCADFKGGKGPNGEPLSEIDQKLQAKFESLLARGEGQKVSQIIEMASGISDDGFVKYAVKQAAQQVFGETAEKIAGGSVNVIQWADTAAQIISTLKKIGPAMKATAYALGATSMVKLWMTYRSGVDEMKAGHADPQLVGSLANTLGPNQQKLSDGSYGGTSAEATPLYTAVVDGDQPTKTVSLLDGLVPAKALAASSSASTTTYTCDSGSPVPLGHLICPEEGLVISNFATGISDVIKNPPFSWVASLADYWNSIGKYIKGPLNYVTDHVTGFIGSLPGISQLQNGIAGSFQSMAEGVIKDVLPTPFSDNMSGGRSGDLAIGGADAAGNEFAHHGLGGKVLTNDQVTTILQEQQQEQQQQFSKMSMFAKIFNKDSNYSLVTKVAMAMPTNLNSAVSGGLSSLLRNPFATMANVFGSILSFGRAQAATTPADMCTNGGPFGITCYGVTNADIPNDQESYWDQNCKDNKFTDNWNEQSTKNINPNTQQPENNTVNPCLLIQSGTGSDGAVYNSSLLTADDLADSGSNAPPSQGTTATGSIYVIGDSLTVGMNGQGKLSDKLKAANLTPTQVEATVGIKVADSITKLQADAENVKKANAVVVELGINNCQIKTAPFSCAPAAYFYPVIKGMTDAIRNINKDPNTQIYWVNSYSAKGTFYQSLNQAISDESLSTKLNYKVIDWAGEVKANPAKYSFDSAQGLHQVSPSGYDSMAQFVVGALH